MALQVAAGEARKGHADLAKDLREIVERSRQINARGLAQGGVLHIAQPQGEVADLLSVRHPSTRLSDLILDEAAAAHVRRVLNEQRQFDKLKSHGLRPRQTLLLTGPPGCGKTLTASAIAGELSKRKGSFVSAPATSTLPTRKIIRASTISLQLKIPHSHGTLSRSALIPRKMSSLTKMASLSRVGMSLHPVVDSARKVAPASFGNHAIGP